MNKNDKLKKIYEVIADKTLSFGCKVLIKKESTLKTEGKYYWGKTVIIGRTEGVNSGGPLLWEGGHINIKQKTKYKIIGHPVMIGDVLDWYQGKPKQSSYGEGLEYYDLYNEILECWDNTRKPIDYQSEETIDFIYSLIG